MRYCIHCGREIAEGAAFCIGCGAPVEAPAPVEPPIGCSAAEQEEREFLENTHRLLRWEHKAWSIASKAFLITGIAFAALYMTIGLIGAIAAAVGDDFVGGVFVFMGVFYAILFGGMFIALGIVSKKAAEKLPQYIDTVYTDLSLAYNRCGNVGMLIFNVLLGVVSPIFFIINFVRMKRNRAVIERILQNQQAWR